MTKELKGEIGSSFDTYLKEEEIFEETQSHALKRFLVWQIEQAMRERGMTKLKMAQLMKTSRSQLNRFLDPENETIQLTTIYRAATAVGKRVTINIEDVRGK